MATDNFQIAEYIENPKGYRAEAAGHLRLALPFEVTLADLDEEDGEYTEDQTATVSLLLIRDNVTRQVLSVTCFDLDPGTPTPSVLDWTGDVEGGDFLYATMRQADWLTLEVFPARECAFTPQEVEATD